MPEKIRGPHKAPGPLAIALIASAQLMIVLDITIVNVALPSIGKAFSFSPTSLTWVVDAYTLVFGGLLLLGGRSGDIFGRRKMFMIGVLLFAGASFAGGFATSGALLIAARALQGIGGAIASPTALALIASNFEDLKERTEALAIFAAVSAAGASIGLIAGALLTQYLSWRWVFFVNTPIAITLAILAPRVLRESEKQHVPADFIGAVASILGVSGIVYGFIHSAASGWTSPISIGAFGIGVVGLISFYLRERSAKQPLLNLSIFSNRNRSGAYAVMFLVAAALFSLWFFLTQFLQDVLGYSPLKAGFAFLPMTATVMLIAKNGARAMRKIGPLPLLVYGPMAVGLALFLFSRLGPGASYTTHVLPILLLNATGLGATFSAVFPTSMTGVTSKEAGLSSVMVSVAQQVGGSLGISVLATVSAASATNKAAQLVASHFTGHNAKILIEVSGWTSGFKAGAVMAVFAGIIALFSVRRPKQEAIASGVMPSVVME